MQQTPFLEDDPARQALKRAAAALDEAEGLGQPIVMSQALAAVARCYRLLHAPAAAEAYLEMALRWGRAAQAQDQVVDLLCELCETAIALARAQEADTPGSGRAACERARDHAFEASLLAPRVADADWEVKVLLRVSDALNRLGDHVDASGLQTRALRLMNGSPDLDVAELPGLGRLADG